jgi:two-component system, LytTR family, response regulator
MRALRAVVVDDEPLARARLARLLGSEQGVQVVAEYGDGASAAGGIRALAPDVAFVDVRMPGLDGFGLVEQLPAEQRPLIVFVTAYSEHAVEAFDARALDYLVKPVAPDRLQESVQRVRRQLGAASAAAPLESRYPERLAVPDGTRLRIVPVGELECVRAQGNYLALHVGTQELLLRETLANLEAKLDPRAFVRIHRSHLVRIDRIEQLESCGAGQYVVRMRSGLRVSSGRSYRAALRRALGLPPASEPEAGSEL